MNKFIEVIAIVEGRTEQIFVEKVLTPYLANKNIYMKATQITKPGQKGGDVKFSRAENDIGRFLKQRADIFVTQFFDYYGLKEWPNLEGVALKNHIEIAQMLNKGAVEQLKVSFPDLNIEQRYIPYMAMHEFESLLFSDAQVLANALNVKEQVIIDIINECGEPEKINNSRETAPSKRLDNLKSVGSFKKTTEGISIAENIGIDKMRAECPIFDAWIEQLEELVT